jgi:REP element-mobilizing transposase RayT
MQIQPYEIDKLSLAGDQQVSLRWKTHGRKPNPKLPTLDENVLCGLLRPADTNILQLACTDVNMDLQVTLQPQECVSAAVGRIKARASKWLQAPDAASSPKRPLARGYFAATVGDPTVEEVQDYLQQQPDDRASRHDADSTLYVARFKKTGQARHLLAADHAVTRLQFHIVLVTSQRQPVFTQSSARSITDDWQARLAQLRVIPNEICWLPDHVHIGISVHPGVVPAEVAIALMNMSQDLMWNQFGDDATQFNQDRLWQPTAYVASFGGLTASATGTCLQRWNGHILS